MGTPTEAIYEGGVLRPVQPLALAEHERVPITVEPLDDLIDHEYIAQCRAEVAKMDCIPTIEETREKLRAVPDSFADEILRSRSDRSQFFNTKKLKPVEPKRLCLDNRSLAVYISRP